MSASPFYSLGPEAWACAPPQRIGNDHPGLSPPPPSSLGSGTCRAGSDIWGINVSRQSLASSHAGSAPPPLFLPGFQFPEVKAATTGLNETCVGLVSRKPPGDPVFPQTSIFRRQQRRRGAERSVSSARAAAGAAGRGRATSPSPAMHRLARGGSRHHTLRPGCSRCRSNKLLRPPALSTEEHRPPSPPPPPSPFSARTRRPEARAAPWSTLSGRRSNFDSGLGFRTPCLLGSSSLASRWGEGNKSFLGASALHLAVGNLFPASGERACSY